MRREDTYPLSPMQHGMLVRSLAAPQSGVYVQQLVCRFQESVDANAFKEAWRRIGARHPIFRTSFHWQESTASYQRVHREAELQFVQQDCRHLAETRREEMLGTFLAADRRRGFELDQAPLSRHALFRFGIADHRWVWTSHHAVMDGRSRLLLLGELFELYDDLRAARTSDQPKRPPFRHYIDWLSTQDGSAAEQFWTRELEGFTSPTPLGVDRALAVKIADELPTHDTQTFRFSEGFTRSLCDVARQHGLTPNTFLQGAWAVLLSRYSGEQDVVFGSTRAGRHADIESPAAMVGLLIHTVPVRIRAAPSRPLLDWLQELRSRWVGLRDHERTPLVDIQKWSRVPLDQPLFESLLTFENHELNSALQGLLQRKLDADFRLIGRTNYPLAVTGTLGPELRLNITYDRSRFDFSAISRMLGHLRSLLDSMVANPARRIADLPLLSGAERHQLLVEWNDTTRDYPGDKCIHQLFEQQAERTPDAVAVVFEYRQLTYRELNARANQLAHYLKKLGVGPEAVVGILMARSLEMIVGLLGILKAGGAYLPLHPTAPRDRLHSMLEDSHALAVLTQQELWESHQPAAIRSQPSEDRESTRSPALVARPSTVCLDSDWHVISQEPATNLDSSITTKNLAYVIYTSGSTGKPKGVLIEHCQILNYVQGIEETCGLTPGASYAMVQPLSVDSSQTVIFPPLISGGALHVISEETAMDPQALEVHFARFPIDVLKIAPSHLAALWQVSPQPEQLLPRRWLILGGESSRPGWVAQLQAKARCAIYNHYGPTEATVGVLTYPITKVRDAVSSPTVPIGRPLPNAEAYVLDRCMQPVPIGIAGELYIGGSGLARGYLDRPELSAEKFLPHPFSERPGARLYRTGDVARYQPDGNIELLGRTDHQVKIRGFRVEPAEVAAALGDHPAVRASVVMAREDGRGERQLVAYVVPQPGHEIAASELRRFLKLQLPDYMVPASFERLNELPLTPHGKVDLRALPAPTQTTPDPDRALVEPRTHAEEILAGIWAEVLELERVGIHDNFLDLGGHSLLVTQVASRIRSALQVELPLRELFAHPTVAGMAERIEDIQRKQHTRPIRPLLPVARDKELPLSFAQQRLWFLDQFDPASTVYNVPGAIRIRGFLQVTAFERSLNEIIRRHEALRTTFSPRNGIPVQTVSPSRNLSLAVVNLADHPESGRETEARRLAIENAQRLFDLARGPLLRPLLLRLGEDDFVFSYPMHHIVSDAWSQTIFLRELSILYGAFAAEQASPLPPLSIQYADHAVWQRDWLQGEILENQLAYWREQLGDVPALQLPTDHPRPARRSFRGAKQRFALPRALSDRLHELSRSGEATLFMTLLAAFQVLLHRCTGQDDIAVGSPIAGRSRHEIEGLIGFFLNTLVFRTDFSDDPSFVELLGRVKEVALDAYAHQDVPFERLVEELQPERDPGRSPLFQVLFVHQDKERPVFASAGITSSPIEIDTATAKFDLTLSLRETENGLTGYVEYNTDLFDPVTIDRMAGNFQALLRGIVENPHLPVSGLPILTRIARQQPFAEWNETKRGFPGDKCIHQLFEQQVERTPDGVAVAFDDRQLSYRELNARSNQLAHFLRRRGVGPEEFVAICMGRSIEMIVAVLGVLKSGAAYVPIDPDYPAERFHFMLEDAQAPLVVTQAGVLDGTEHAKVCLDTDWGAISQEREDNPSHVAGPGNAAYAIYTSGSTGKPKGAVLEHRPLCNLITWQLENSACAAPARTLQFSSLSFDVSFQETFTTLCSGGTLVLVTDEVRRDPTLLLRYLSTHGVERIFLPFAALQQLANAAAMERALPAQLREIINAGEQLQATPRIMEFFERIEGCRLVNQYGPTETHVVAAFHMLADSPRDWTSLPPIGRPIANAQLHILDLDLEPVAVERAGELHIGGAVVGRGYFRRPDLTAERFIPDPFSDLPGARLYKTGDLGRYLPDGNIEYLGRIDDQVKIRGYRIEPGEIETSLNQHSAVQQCVVVVRQDAPEERRLVAYVVANPGPSATEHELRRFLRGKLPEFMLPSGFVFVDALPLTPNGKVDRKALPAPGHNRLTPDGDFIAPRTPAEELLAGIWADVLQVDRVGIDEDFFELGGHSLLAVQLAFKISTALKCDVSVKMLFLHPTIGELAAVLDEDCRQKAPIRENRPKTITVAQTRKDQVAAQGQVANIEFERRPLLSLIAAGKILPVDAAALGYVSEETLSRAGLTREAALVGWYDGLPTVDGVYETARGRVAIIRLPRLRSELYDSKEELVSSIVDALEIARQIGARAVSLTGLLPSATDYGQAVANAIAKRSDLPVVTTGHATTVSAVVMTIERILRDAGRDLAHESVTFLGLGSIGYTTLRLMLRCLPHPRKILICDVFGKKTWLDKVGREIIDDLGFKGLVEVAAPRQQLPPEVYGSSLIVGATNVPNILDIGAVRPGTLIVDDSGPHCFAAPDAIRRFEAKHDILFTEGGVVQMPGPWHHLKYLPHRVEQMMHPGFVEAMSTRNPSQIGSCVLSSLLSAGKEKLVPTLGLPDQVACLEHYRGLQRLECGAAMLHCEGYVLPSQSIATFRSRFGGC